MGGRDDNEDDRIDGDGRIGGGDDGTSNGDVYGNDETGYEDSGNGTKTSRGRGGMVQVRRPGLRCQRKPTR
jgi:hypothetical protein